MKKSFELVFDDFRPKRVRKSAFFETRFCQGRYRENRSKICAQAWLSTCIGSRKMIFESERGKIGQSGSAESIFRARLSNRPFYREKKLDFGRKWGRKKPWQKTRQNLQMLKWLSFLGSASPLAPVVPIPDTKINVSGSIYPET